MENLEVLTDLQKSRQKLWTYSVAVFLRSSTIVKFGDHRCETYEEAHLYATSEGNTVGKLQGLVGSNPDVKVLSVDEVTDCAREIDPNYDPAIGGRKGFDNAMRPYMPGKRKMHVNVDGKRSLELHIMSTDLTDEEVEWEWKNAVAEFKNGGAPVPGAEYYARNYLEDAKAKAPLATKYLLGATTGAGKETSTLALLVQLHDDLEISNRKIHLAVATIPSTITELFEELSTVKGMWYDDEYYADFSYIIPYVTDAWMKSYGKDCSIGAQRWMREHATVISAASELPKTHEKGYVPVLFGSFHDVALKSYNKLSGRYAGLDGRIGIMSIGEAHKMLAPENKLWKNVAKIRKEYLLCITGTPYDFIYGESGALFFDTDERSLWTRNDLYIDKNTNPKSEYSRYPDFIYYHIKEIMDEVVEKMKVDPRWADDAEGFTFWKIHEYMDGEFKYKDMLVYFYNRLLGLDAFNDGMNIHNAPNLCELAKRHIIVALPVGTAEAGVELYVPELVKLLKENGSLGNYHPLVAYDKEDSLSAIKETIAEDEFPTATFTCIKHLTGANIPQWGSLIMLRPIGDSIKFFEQATGRIGRAYDGKDNCGVFIGDLEAAMNIIVTVEEKISIERGEDYSHSEIVNRTLNCYQFFTGKNGAWHQFDMPDVVAELEKLSAKGNYGVGMCVKKTEAPDDFGLIFKHASTESTNVELNASGNEGAKNKLRKKIKQFGIEFANVVEAKKQEYWHNMKKSHVARLRKLAFVYELNTVEQCLRKIDHAISYESHEDDSVLEIMGRGVELIPGYMHEGEIDIRYTNKWLNKMHLISDIELLLQLWEDPMLQDHATNFIAEPLNRCEKIASDALEEYTPDMKVADIFGGRGAFLICMIKQAERDNIDFNTELVYYNDIDPSQVEVFKKLNEKFNLGIPAKNITCMDAKEIEMEFDRITINSPYDLDGEKGGQRIVGGQNKIYPQHIKKALSLLSSRGKLIDLCPASVTKKSKRISLVGMEGLKEVDFTANADFPDQGVKILQFVVDKTYVGDVKVTASDDTVSYYPNTSVIYDSAIVDVNFVPTYEALKDITDAPDKRMFRQNNFGEAALKEKDSKHKFTLNKLEDEDDTIYIVETYYSRREPYFYKEKKITIGMTKAFNEDCVYVGKEDFDSGYMTTSVKNNAEVENIKSFIFSNTFKQHSVSWKALDQLGYNYALKYLPPFDKTKKWNDKEVKDFLESFV